MQDAMTATIAVAALFFSIMCALLLEEFIFGGLFHLLRPVRRNAQVWHGSSTRARGSETRATHEALFGTLEK
jgi:hypothetical protein